MIVSKDKHGDLPSPIFIGMHIFVSSSNCEYLIKGELDFIVDVENIAIILNFPAPTLVKQLSATLGHIFYYKKFIRIYASLIVSLEELLRNENKYIWT